MTTSVFIGFDHSVENLVNSLYSVLKQNGIEVYAIETGRYKEFPVAYNVQELMKKSDCIFYFLTHNTIRSKNTFLELGMARATHKNLILIVEFGVDIPKGLNDLPIIFWDKFNPSNTINQITNYSFKIKEEKEKSNSVLGVLFLLGALAFLAALSSEENEEGN